MEDEGEVTATLEPRYGCTLDRGRRPIGWRDAEHHGHLVFYTSVERGGGREWFEYRAKFTDGPIVDVVRPDERARSALPAGTRNGRSNPVKGGVSECASRGGP